MVETGLHLLDLGDELVVAAGQRAQQTSGGARIDAGKLGVGRRRKSGQAFQSAHAGRPARVGGIDDRPQLRHGSHPDGRYLARRVCEVPYGGDLPPDHRYDGSRAEKGGVEQAARVGEFLLRLAEGCFRGGRFDLRGGQLGLRPLKGLHGVARITQAHEGDNRCSRDPRHSDTDEQENHEAESARPSLFPPTPRRCHVGVCLWVGVRSTGCHVEVRSRHLPGPDGRRRGN